MAISFDAFSGGATNGTTSLTVSHTCASGATALFTAVTGDGTPSDVITGVTYNGVSMTQVAKSLGGIRANYLYYLASPASGTHDIVVSASSSVYVGAASASYLGSSVTSQPEATGTNSAAAPATSVTTSCTVVTDQSWLVLAGMYTGGGATAGSGTTLRGNDGFSGVGIASIYDSAGGVGTGSHSLIFNSGGAFDISGVVAALAPTGGASVAFIERNSPRGVQRGVTS